MDAVQKLFTLAAISLLAPAMSARSARAQNFRLPSPQFSDTSAHWAALCIEGMGTEQLMKGYLDGTFRPESTLTRAEFAAIVVKAFADAPTLRATPIFSDVAEDYWGKRAITTAYERGFLAGYPDNSFRPSQAITRAQAMVIIANAQQLSPPVDLEAVLTRYFDDEGEIPDYARGAISAATTHRQVVNYPFRNQLRPNSDITRGEATALFCRFNAASADARYYVPNQYVAGNLSSHPELKTTTILSTAFSSIGSLLQHRVELNQSLFFVGTSSSVGPELWETDGTVAGTQLVRGLALAGDDGQRRNLRGAEFVGLADRHFWMASEPRYPSDTLAVSFWSSDGTADNTQPVAALNPALAQLLNEATDLTVEPNSVFKNRLPFVVATPSGTRLWMTDGETETGTYPLAEFPYSLQGQRWPPQLFTPTDHYFLFGVSAAGNATETDSPGSDFIDNRKSAALWRSDGTPENTLMIKAITPTALTRWRNHVYLQASTPETGGEWWISDGTTAGTQLLKDIYPGEASSAPHLLSGLGTSFFSLVNAPEGFELWATQGTPESTRRVKQLSTEPFSLELQRLLTPSWQRGNQLSEASFQDNQPLIVHQDRLFFSAAVPRQQQQADGTTATVIGSELWITDGTEAGTQRLATLRVSPEGFTAFNGRVFFSGLGPDGHELWVSDGSPEGTYQVIDLLPGINQPSSDRCSQPLGPFYPERYACVDGALPNSARPRNLTVHGDFLYFIADDLDLFRTDGTALGLQRVGGFGFPSHDWQPHIATLGPTLLVMGFEEDTGTPTLWALPETDGF